MEEVTTLRRAASQKEEETRQKQSQLETKIQQLENLAAMSTPGQGSGKLFFI